ncbi:HAMP domain-containing histidine kinase [Neorhizobium galegae]|nr:HAMP domain-containing histidine kinase [Neorhizobium galegae]
MIDGAAQRLTRTKTAATPQFLEGKALQIKGAVARMVELMESILAAGRLETGTIAINKEAGSLSSILRHCIASRAEISKSHTISHDLEALPALQMIDGAAIERVFFNLLSNAVKYSPAGSKIRVSGWKDGRRVLVSVSDSGIGMDADDLPKLFEPYFRARSATRYRGNGNRSQYRQRKLWSCMAARSRSRAFWARARPSPWSCRSTRSHNSIRLRPAQSKEEPHAAIDEASQDASSSRPMGLPTR